MPTTEFSFDANDKRVKQVLFQDRRYRVPRYQRPYTWTSEQVSEFWNDLVTNNEPYFLGSFVFCTEAEKDEGCVEIIDGQQRLLTITIFSAVLRDHAKSYDTSVATRYQRQDISIEDRTGNETYRIIPDDSLAQFFEKNIQRYDSQILNVTTSTPEEAKVKENYEYLLQKVKEEMDRFDRNDLKLRRLDELRSKVSELVVIDVEIARDEDAYEIFETTNARGIDLSVSDLLKNLIFKKVRPNQDRDFAKEVWQEITQNIQSTGTEMKRFIRYFWLSKYAMVTEKRLYREIRNRTSDWDALLKELWDDSDRFSNLLEGNEDIFDEYKNGEKIFESLSALRIMEVSQCFVFLMSVLRNYKKLDTDPTRIIKIIEKFTLQYSAVCNLPSNRIEKLYSKYATHVESVCNDIALKNRSGKIQQIFAELEKELKDASPSYALFEESFVSIEYRKAERNRRLIKYILGNIDASLRSTKEYKIDFNNVNIEHILPQTPDKAWGVTKNDIKPFVNRIGNLTLIDKRINSKLQNKVLSEKLVDLEKSTLPITSELVQFMRDKNLNWNSDSIDEYAKVLSKRAYNEVWKF